MEAAILEAKKARHKGCYSIGAVIVKGNKVISRGSNRVKIDNDPTSHAEIVAIRSATKKLGSRYLEGCVLYSTHEPCPMCAAAAIWAKMSGIIFGSQMEDMKDYRAGSGNSKWQWRTIEVKTREILRKGDPQLDLIENFMREECVKLFHN